MEIDEIMVTIRGYGKGNPRDFSGTTCRAIYVKSIEKMEKLKERSYDETTKEKIDEELEKLVREKIKKDSFVIAVLRGGYLNLHTVLSIDDKDVAPLLEIRGRLIDDAAEELYYMVMVKEIKVIRNRKGLLERLFWFV